MKSNRGGFKILFLYVALFLIVNTFSYVHIISCQNIMESSTQVLGQDVKDRNQIKMENNVMLDIVSIPQGQLRGLMMKSRIGREYFSFRRIPYAKPPKRFEPAEPPVGWHGVLDATKAAPICPQIPLQSPTNAEGQEDCLYLSVNVPKCALHRRNIGHLYPVIVYIHEGAFMIGSGDEHGSEFFMDEDVLLVTFNYRVGALGFLSTGDGEIPGNMGLKDQVLALKWVQANIHLFGGDPRRVTIYGESAGAVSVQLHMLSPMSAGLFSRVISQSGSALVPWAVAKNPAGTAFKLGAILGCNSRNSSDLAICLKSKDYKEIIFAQLQLREWHLDPIVPFPPTVEVVSTTPCYNQCYSQTATFLSEHPYRMILQGRFQRVPLLTGINKDEGLLFHSASVSHADDLFYFFNFSYAPDVITPGSRDEIFSEKIVKLWVSFAYYGKPMDSWMTDAEWLPVQSLESVGGIPAHYYDLNMEFRRIESPFTNRMHFWNRVMDIDLQEELIFIPFRSNKTAMAANFGQLH